VRQEPTNLKQVLDRLENITKRGQITLGDIVNHFGKRTVGALLLLAGLITLAPVIGDIPGVPTIMGIFVFLTAIQLLIAKENIWLPNFILRRSVSQSKMVTAIKWMRPAARFMDRFLHPRHPRFVQGPAIYAIAIMCMLIALVMPIMELVPFSANLAGAALTAFGLALTAHDGLLALIAFVLTAIIFVTVLSILF
jgi:hypothetical protein